MERLRHERQAAPLTRRLEDLNPQLKDLRDQLNGLTQAHAIAESQLQGKKSDQQQMETAIMRSRERLKNLQSQCRSAERTAAAEAISRRDEKLKQN
jgi:chromosome segregation ATPase